MMIAPEAAKMPSTLRLAPGYSQNASTELALAASAATLQQNLVLGL
jgi:hypothetical protein